MKKLFTGIIVLVLAIVTVYFFFPGVIISAAVHAARMSAGLSRHEVLIDNYHWAYLDGGKGNDAIVFINGFNQGKDDWHGMLKEFSGSFRIVAPDMPGFGENDRIMTENYGLPEQSSRLRKFIKSTGLKSYHLMGESLGGSIAAYYAGEYPEEVKSLAMIGPFGVRSKEPSEGWKQYLVDHKVPFAFRTEKELDYLMGVAYDHPPAIPGPFKKVYCVTGHNICRFQ